MSAERAGFYVTEIMSQDALLHNCHRGCTLGHTQTSGKKGLPGSGAHRNLRSTSWCNASFGLHDLMRGIARKDWALPPARARVTSQTIQDEIATIRQLGIRFSVWCSTSVSLRLLCLVVAPLLICSLLFACALFRRSLEILLLSGKQPAVPAFLLGTTPQHGPCDSFLGCTANFLANSSPPAPYPSFVVTSQSSTCPSNFYGMCRVATVPRWQNSIFKLMSPIFSNVFKVCLSTNSANCPFSSHIFYFLIFLTTPLSASMALIPSTLLFLCSILSSLSCFYFRVVLPNIPLRDEDIMFVITKFIPLVAFF